MNVVFLSPHFPPGWHRFAVALREAGATVLGIADVDHESLPADLRASLGDYYRVTDVGNYDQLVRALGWFISRHGRIDRLDSLNEHWLEIEAGLRTDFNIPGLNRRTIGAVKRKSLMKRRFEAIGLTPPRGVVCRTPAELRAFVGQVGWPVIAKPDVGVGAAGTFRLDGESDIERYLRTKLAGDYIVEEFVDGELMTYDGLVDREGRIVFDSTLIYSMGVMELVNEGHDLCYWIPREIPADIAAIGRQMARAFDVQERPFHFEIFRMADGRLVPLEVNMRPPGGPTVDMFNFANDYDFYRAWAEVMVHGRFEAAPSRRYACMYVSRRAHRAYALSHDEVIRQLGELIVHQTRVEGVFAAAMGDHGYLLRHPQLAALTEAARVIQRLA